MATALDAPDSVLDDTERQFVRQIRTNGWFRTEVFADDEGPGFSFTTGFWVNLGFPEVIAFSMPSKTIHAVLWDLYRMVAAGSPPPIGKVTSSVFGNADALLMPVAGKHYEPHLGWSRWFYGNDDFPCVQLLWPSREGIFPGHAGADDALNGAQPILYEDVRHMH
ncbi:hypothetical protein BZL54_19310 [Burkholderia ubonensis subsp. mesacidophila]|uniref:DUF4262 domain-containing protein n=1 Tax=Burkholderia ubonensis subsp. mesacidophila TaxID=265293 RepID=A0A2A4FDV3_9BURK|nr:hypothetical protein BZL54_19310 [Burkholderia ubonensis subsp. mesacidophila]